MVASRWLNDDDYLVWLWETSHLAYQNAPAGSRVYAEAAVHALLATLRETGDVPRLRVHYQAVNPTSLALIQSVLAFGPGSDTGAPLTDADYEWLLVLEDAAYYLRYCELCGIQPETASSPRRSR